MKILISPPGPSHCDVSPARRVAPGRRGTITRIAGITVACLSFLLVAGFGGNAQAGESPFSVSLMALFVGHDREAGLFALEGSATRIGPVTGLARHEVRGFKELGIFYLEDNSGNRLQCIYQIDADPVLAVGTFEIVGGTGRFANATGGGAMFVDETHVTAVPFPVELVGTISL